MAIKGTVKEQIFQKLKNLNNKSGNLYRIAYYNTGYLKDAENFNLVSDDYYEPRGSKKHLALSSAGNFIGSLFYRSYLLVFFSLYLFIYCLAFFLRLLVKLSLRFMRTSFRPGRPSNFNSEKSFL